MSHQASTAFVVVDKIYSVDPFGWFSYVALGWAEAQVSTQNPILHQIRETMFINSGTRQICAC